MEPEEAKQEGLTEDEINEGELEFADKQLSGHRVELEWLEEHHMKDVTVALTSGETITGYLKRFDAETLLVGSKSVRAQSTLIYKNSIQSVSEPTSRGGRRV